MDLVKFISRKIALIEELEDNDGEISTKTEGELEVLNAQIRENADSYVDYRQSLDASIEKYKQLIKAYVAVQEKKKSRLDDFLKYAVEKIGPIKTPFSSINVTTRESQSIVISDFDLCAKTYPDAVTIKTMDNLRTIYISKDELKKHYKNDLQCVGFEVVQKSSSWVAARQRVNVRSQIEVTNGIANTEN